MINDIVSGLDFVAALLTVAYLWHLISAGRDIQIDVFQKRSLLNQNIAIR